MGCGYLAAGVTVMVRSLVAFFITLAMTAAQWVSYLYPPGITMKQYTRNVTDMYLCPNIHQTTVR